MRLWSLHPRYLDVKGLTACWREGLLARKVLTGQTRGYTRHPQLERFRATADPVAAVDTYLHGILREALCRGYRFDPGKLGPEDPNLHLEVTIGQLSWEWEHLREKLRKRQPEALKKMKGIERPQPHTLFIIKEGGPEPWERTKE